MQYSVIFKNESSNYGKVCIYQEDPFPDVDVMTLAWLTKPAHPLTTVQFTWSTDYIFTWGEIGELQPGTIFEASQIIRADLIEKNKVELLYQQNAYKFGEVQKDANHEGELYIVQKELIPLKQATVGIGMSGFGTFVKQAQPNMHLFFRPHPKYWITFGDYSQGEFLDITSITNRKLLQFGPGIYSLTATLKQDNSWKITPAF